MDIQRLLSRGALSPCMTDSRHLTAIVALLCAAVEGLITKQEKGNIFGDLSLEGRLTSPPDALNAELHVLELQPHVVRGVEMCFHMRLYCIFYFTVLSALNLLYLKQNFKAKL